MGIEVDKVLVGDVGGLVSPTYSPWFGRPYVDSSNGIQRFRK